ARFKILGVRDYRSQRILATYGISSVVTGDTALALERTSGPSNENTVGICLVGEPMRRHGDAARTQEIVTDYAHRALAEGCHVALVPCCESDLDIARAMQRQLGDRVQFVDFWASPISENLDRFLTAFSRLRFIVGERLHASVLASAMGISFVALPYKPKCRD